MPLWMGPAGACLAGVALYTLFARTLPLPVEAGAMWVRFGIEASACFWAAKGRGLHPGIRRSLRLFGGTTVYSSVVLAGLVANEVGAIQGWDAALSMAGSFSYIVGLAALLQYPRAPLRRWHRLMAAVDILLVVGPLATVQGLVLMQTPWTAARSPIWVYIYAIAQVSMMGGLSVLTTLGRPTPSPRAYWLFVGAMSFYVPVTLLGQLADLYAAEGLRRASLFLYFGGVVITLAAAYRLRHDGASHVLQRPEGAEGAEGAPQAMPGRSWFLGLNPLTLGMPFVLGAALIGAILRQMDAALLPLSIAGLGVMFLIVFRLVLAARDNLRLLKEEATTQRRLEQARADERARLMADVHDGFGSQLVSARIRAGHGQLSAKQLEELLGECLADLYLVIDTLRAQNNSLSAALADYRGRLRRRLASLPVEFHWRIQLAGASEVPSRVILQILRVVQEAINNALRHSQGHNIWVSVERSVQGGLLVEVEDDGVGVAETTASGRGLDYMRIRARAIGAQLSIGARPAGQGTLMSLHLPSAGAEAATKHGPRA